jgi:hypothetical protein
VSSKSIFPRRSDIFRPNMKDIRDTVARPSLDTFYQVTFSFGKADRWLGSNGFRQFSGSSIPLPSDKRSQGRNYKDKMSILCTEAEIPGTSFQTSLAVGHHQGIQEEFPNLRSFPPLNLTFYLDADMVVLEVLEKWMTYINPISTNKRDLNAYGRFNYPDDYKEIIHLTKFERDTFGEPKEYQSRLTTYEFVNVWPTNLTSMRVAYGDSNVLRCSVQLAYDRFFADFGYNDTHQVPINGEFLPSNPKLKTRSSKDSPQQQERRGGQGGLALGTTTNRQGGLY